MIELQNKKIPDSSCLTKAQRWQIADWMAEARLPQINAGLMPVKPRRSFYGTYIKRVIDIAVSLAALLVTLPINLILGLVTYFDVGRPVLFAQERMGKDGKVFLLVKFRNMTNETDETGELLPPAQRVTGWGRFVRKTSLDELLNFWSVLKGDMSLIGPRPLPPEYTHRYHARHKMRLAVRPGLECPPHEPTSHVRTWHEQFENDVWYVENLSFRTDCRMLLNLVRFALHPKNTADRASAGRKGTFMGYDTEGRAVNTEAIPTEYLERIFAASEPDASKGYR